MHILNYSSIYQYFLVNVFIIYFYNQNNDEFKTSLNFDQHLIFTSSRQNKDYQTLAEISKMLCGGETSMVRILKNSQKMKTKIFFQIFFSS